MTKTVIQIEENIMAEISIILHIVRKLNSIIVLLFIQNISTEFILNKPIPLHRFSSNLWPFSRQDFRI